MKWKYRITKKNKETYWIYWDDKCIEILKDPSVDTSYLVKICGPYDYYTRWASDLLNIKDKLVRYKVPQEIIDGLERIFGVSKN